jgi:hypothetical protein
MAFFGDGATQEQNHAGGGGTQRKVGTLIIIIKGTFNI